MRGRLQNVDVGKKKSGYPARMRFKTSAVCTPGKRVWHLIDLIPLAANRQNTVKGHPREEEKGTRDEREMLIVPYCVPGTSLYLPACAEMIYPVVMASVPGTRVRCL
jgi:hypothetical protein